MANLQESKMELLCAISTIQKIAKLPSNKRNESMKTINTIAELAYEYAAKLLGVSQ
jgi:hypothetical protein